MNNIFGILYVILTMEELAILRYIVIAISFAIGIVLCKFANVKVSICVMCFVFLLVVLGEVVFWSGAIEGWALMTICFPFLVGLVTTNIVYYTIKYIFKKNKQKRRQR